VTSQDPRYLGDGEAWVPNTPAPPPPGNTAATSSGPPPAYPPTPPAAQSNGPTPPDQPPSGQVRIAGIARAVDRRRDEGTETLRFRLDMYDQQTGDRVESYGVEMSGAAIAGGIGENEPVYVTGHFAGGTLLAAEIYDTQTEARITPLGPAAAFHRRFGGRKGLTAGYLALFGVIAAIVVTVFVVIIVSLSNNATKKVQLPNVVGRPAGEARFELAQAGVNSGKIRIEGNNFCKVARQDPAGGAKVSPDSTVTLVAQPTGRNDPVGCN
jgi:hypothetical protein